MERGGAGDSARASELFAKKHLRWRGRVVF
jgi:hypothetical protein